MAAPAPANSPRKLFLHLEYHPDDVSRKTVRQLFERHCGQLTQDLGLDRMTVAYSRAKNIRDYVPMPSSIRRLEGRLASTWGGPSKG